MWRQRNFFVALLVLISATSVLVIIVITGITTSLDLSFHNLAVGLNTPSLVLFWKGLSILGSVAVLTGFTIASLGYLFFRLMAITMLGAVVIDNASKWLVGRPRPDEIYSNTMPASYSFPSGHALYNFLFYFTLVIIMTRKLPRILNNILWAFAILIVALIGASRVFLGVHYVTDVLGGYLIAAIWMVVILQLLKFPNADVKTDNQLKN
jgi:undecaprenyl-diphosphatase